MQLGRALDQARAELREDREVEARVGQFEPEGVLPVDPTAHRVGGLAVGEALFELHHGDESEPPGALGGSALRREERSEARILVEWAEDVSDLQVEVALQEGGFGHPDRLLGNLPNRLGTKRHRKGSSLDHHSRENSPRRVRDAQAASTMFAYPDNNTAANLPGIRQRYPGLVQNDRNAIVGLPVGR